MSTGRVLAGALAILLGAAGALIGVCGPFTDTANDAFCPFVLEILTMGITTGTTATTFSPTDNVSRLQMAAFLSRSVDGVVERGSRRAALDQFWTTQASTSLGLTTVGNAPLFVQSDGADLWVSVNGDGNVVRVRASDGKKLEEWNSAPGASGVLVALGRVFVAGNTNPGRLYSIDPTQPAGNVTTVASNLGGAPLALTFDGAKIYVANFAFGGSVSLVTPGAAIPWTVTTVATGFTSVTGTVFDGSNVWVTDSADTLLKLDPAGAILQTVTVGTDPQFPAFDGANIWVPNANNSISVIRSSTGVVLATLTGNGMSNPHSAAFDGQNILVTNDGNAVSLWKAADLSPLGFLATGGVSQPYGACSDGLHFWFVLRNDGKLARF